MTFHGRLAPVNTAHHFCHRMISAQGASNGRVVGKRATFKCAESSRLHEASGCGYFNTSIGFPGPLHLTPLHLSRLRFLDNFYLWFWLYYKVSCEIKLSI